MAISVRDVPNCCSAIMFTGFGEGVAVAHAGGRAVDRDIKAELVSKIRYYKMMGYGLVTVYTNNTQRKGNRALKECGFKGTKYFKTGKHRTKIKLWHLALQEWKESDVK